PATLLPFCLFFFHLSSHPLALHSFPTRRSSDLLVSGTDGRWSERTSLSLRSLENSTRTAPHSRSKSGLGLRAVYRIRIPNGTARRPTAWPIRPAPNRPRVRPRSSIPSSSSGCHPVHEPLFTSWVPGTTWRAPAGGRARGGAGGAGGAGAGEVWGG